VFGKEKGEKGNIGSRERRGWWGNDWMKKGKGVHVRTKGQEKGFVREINEMPAGQRGDP